jgi:hypothetical protein
MIDDAATDDPLDRALRSSTAARAAGALIARTRLAWFTSATGRRAGSLREAWRALSAGEQIRAAALCAATAMAVEIGVTMVAPVRPPAITFVVPATVFVAAAAAGLFSERMARAAEWFRR